MIVTDNLAVNVFRLAERQQENFTTEAFATLVRHLANRRPAVAVALVESVSGASLPRPDEAPWRVRTQEDLGDGRGIFDLRIQAGPGDVIIEVKLGADAEFAQLSSYLRAIDGDAPSHRVVSLTGRVSGPVPEGVVVRLWHQVAGWLHAQLEAADLGEVDKHVVEQFLGLLYHLRLAAPVARSPLSKGVNEHREKLGGDVVSPLFGRRTRALHHLEPHAELHPLRDLLLLVRQILETLPETKTLSVDSSAGNWTGFILNRLEFLIFVELHDPDRLVVDRWREPGDVDAFDGRRGDERRGRVYESHGAWRWRTSIDLVEDGRGFFDLGATAQRELLTGFLAEALRYGRSLESPGG